MDIVINGNRIQVDGGSVSVVSRNGSIVVNGKTVAADLSGRVQLFIEGGIASVEADGDVSCCEVHGNVTAGGSVSASGQAGPINAGGSVRIG